MARLLRRSIQLGLVACLAVAGPALADPPGRVARVSFLAGSVSFRPSSVTDWTDASLNYPLTIGDHIWTDVNARTELELGGMTVRLAPLSECSILNLDDHVVQLRITQGGMYVRVRDRGPDEVVEVDTPNTAISLMSPGVYRVDVSGTGDGSTVTVRRGDADLETGASAIDLRDGESVALAGVDSPRVDRMATIRIDDFEDWALARDRRADAALSTRYVSPDVIGYADLDQYGAWRDVADY